MTLRSLEIFISVVEEGTMHGAAKKLFISQPSVSGVISDLENEYHIKLFERLGKKLYITPEGKKLYSFARRMISLNEEITMQMSNLENDIPIRIGASVTVGTYVISEIIEDLNGPLPYVFINNTNIIEQHLLNNDLDIALVEGQVQSNDLISIPVIEDELKLICNPNHNLAKLSSVPLKVLSEENFIMREHGSGTRLLVDNAFSSLGITMNVLWECSNAQAILNAVEHSFGVTILTPSLLSKDSNLISIPIEGEIMKRHFSVVYHKDKYFCSRLKKFLDLCQNYGCNR